MSTSVSSSNNDEIVQFDVLINEKHHLFTIEYDINMSYYFPNLELNSVQEPDILDEWLSKHCSKLKIKQRKNTQTMIAFDKSNIAFIETSSRGG